MSSVQIEISHQTRHSAPKTKSLSDLDFGEGVGYITDGTGFCIA